jgi:DNA-directed RNA polymerase specialized sigma24 family protein
VGALPLIRKLHQWCLKWHARVRRETQVPFLPLTDDQDSIFDGMQFPDEEAGKPFDWVDALDQAEGLCSSDELNVVLHHAAGFTGQEAADKLGMSHSNYRIKLLRLRKRLADADRTR